jgi:hypothetical protein
MAEQDTDESQGGVLDTFIEYMVEYADEFQGFEIKDIDSMFEFNVKLEGILLEAELMGLPLSAAVLAPTVGLKLARLDLGALHGNAFPIPLAYLVGDICRNDVPMNLVSGVVKDDGSREVYLPIGSKVFNVAYNDLGLNHQKLMQRFGNLRDVLVLILFERTDGGGIDLNTLRVGQGFEYFPKMKSQCSIDLGEYLPLYMNHYLVTEMCFGDRDMIEMRDRFVGRVMTEYFREIHMPASMVLDAVDTLKLTGDDVRHSRSYRTARFVENLLACAGKSRNTTIVLN